MCSDYQPLINYKEIIKELKTRYIILESGDDFSALSGIFSYCIKWIGNKITSQTLFDLTDGCPACVLTIIKHIDAEYMNIDFNYGDEANNFWNERNRDSRTGFL